MIGKNGSLAVCELGEGGDIAVCVVGIGMSKQRLIGRVVKANVVAAYQIGSTLARNVFILKRLIEYLSLGIKTACGKEGVKIGKSVKAVVYPEIGGA